MVLIMTVVVIVMLVLVVITVCLPWGLLGASRGLKFICVVTVASPGASQGSSEGSGAGSGFAFACSVQSGFERFWARFWVALGLWARRHGGSPHQMGGGIGRQRHTEMGKDPFLPLHLLVI